MFGVLVALLALPVKVASADNVMPPAAEELSLDAIGVGPQAVYGPAGVIEISFPPPVAQLAGSGSFVRIFFSHSANLGEGSGAVITVNGQPLPQYNPVGLPNGTAAGGVAEYSVGTDVLSDQAPNRLRIQFTMKSVAQPPPSPNDLFGRLDGRTLIHYQLAQPGGKPAGLETYPFSLLPTSEQDWPVGVLVPVQPDSEEVGSALRVLADLGYRTGLQRPNATLVGDDPAGWLSSGGRPAVIVSRLDRLPSPELLKATAWTPGDRGLAGPGGRVLGQNEGLVATMVSPWDHHTPLVLVTGANDTALARATAALVGSSGVPLSGDFTVANKAEQDPPAPMVAVPIKLTTPQDLGASRPARYRSSLPFAVPPVDPEGATQLGLHLPSFAGATLKPNFVVGELNGQRIGSSSIDTASPEGRNLEFNFPGRMLRPGNNVLTLDYQLQAPPSQPAAGGTARADDTVTGSLNLPRLPFQSIDLRFLPFPFFENTASHKTAVALTDRAAATMSAAGQALLALGARSATTPPRFQSMVAPKNLPGDSDLIVVGAPPSSGELARLSQTLPVPVADSVGTLQQVNSSNGNVRILWVGGTKDTLIPAARALADQLRGQAVTVDGSGHVRPVAAATPAARIVSAGLPKLLAIVGGVLLALTLALQLIRPRATVDA
jgi:cellulose synthase subunit